MHFNSEKSIKSVVAIVAALAILFVSAWAFNPSAEDNMSTDTVTTTLRTAGVVAAVNDMEDTLIDKESSQVTEAGTIVVAVSEADEASTDLVITDESVASAELALTDEASEDQATADSLSVQSEAEEALAEVEVEEASEWDDMLMADVKDYLTVRSEPDKESAVVGKLRRGDGATIIGQTDGWYQITSGNVEGYVSADYSVVGVEAEEFAEEVCPTYAVTNTAGLRIRGDASEEAKILAAVAEGTKLSVDTEKEEVDGWVAVKYVNKEGYVKAEYVDVSMEIGEGITKEEEAKIIAEKKAAEAKAKAAQVAPPSSEQKGVSFAGDDEVALLAAIIQVEAGNECYEGQVAVGAVIMNRVRSGSYPGSITNVIYAPGQFATGKLNAVYQRGIKSSCYQAAMDAINGIDNVGGCTHFRQAKSGHAGYVIGNHVFF